MCHIRVRSIAPTISTSVVDVGTGVRRGRSSRRSCNTFLVRGGSTNEWVTSADQERLRTDSSRCRPVDGNGYGRHRCPAIGQNVVAIMLRRSEAGIPCPRQINVLANNAISRAARRHRHVCPRGVPRIRDGVVFPCRASFGKVLIKARDDVDFAVTRIIRSACEIPRTRHGCPCAPGASCYVVDLSCGNRGE